MNLTDVFLCTYLEGVCVCVGVGGLEWLCVNLPYVSFRWVDISIVLVGWLEANCVPVAVDPDVVLWSR